MTNQFLALMLDPFVNGRRGVGSTSAAIGFAPDERSNLPPDIALAYASILTKAPKPPTFERRWTTWGSAFGGSNTANGDPAVGSNNITANTYGFASGMDYHVSPYTVASVRRISPARSRSPIIGPRPAARRWAISFRRISSGRATVRGWKAATVTRRCRRSR